MPIDAWPMDAAAGVPSYSGQDLRLDTVVPFVAGAGASLGVRSGVRPSGSGTDLLVQAQAAPNMTVKVNAGVIVVQGSFSATQGAYTWALDAVTTVTIAAAHASLARTDLVVVRIRDAGVDTSGGRDGQPIVITGTAGAGIPSLPTDASYFTLAQVAVGAAVTTIVAGNITDKRQFTAALGGVILCDANSEPSATAVPASQIAYRSDLGVFRAPSGSTWRMVSPYRRTYTVTAAGGDASILFSGIPTFLKTLRLTFAARCTGAINTTSIALQFNGNAGANYFYHMHFIQNATITANSFINVASIQVGQIPANNGTVFGVGTVDIAGWDMTSAMTDRLAVRAQSECYPSQADSYLLSAGGVAVVAPPWTSITLLPGSGNFGQNTRITLEGWD